MPPQLHTAHGNALAIFNLHHMSGRVLQKVEEGYLRGQRTKVSFRQDFEKRAHRPSQSRTSQIVQVVANLLLLYVSEEFLLLSFKLHNCRMSEGLQIHEPELSLCAPCVLQHEFQSQHYTIVLYVTKTIVWQMYQCVLYYDTIYTRNAKNEYEWLYLFYIYLYKECVCAGSVES
jgi:hypothetical protein